jgi:hypothetical protein
MGVRKLFLTGLFCLLATAVADAGPLRLDYTVSDLGGGLYDYEFTLVLDNNDSSWSSGQGWRWLIFGDAPSPGPSPLTAFTIDSGDLPVGPWTGLSSSSGGHNGPSFSPVTTYWIPTAVGETLTWSGTSTANLAQGQMLWSTIAGTLGGAVPANFDVANLVVSPVPEPAGWLLLSVGALALAGVRRRNRRKA